MTLAFELPWPAKILHPNARPHWANKARATKEARRIGYFLALAASRERPSSSWPERIQVKLTFHPPSNRTRDRDGLLANCKAYLDGVADALGVNDSRFDPMPPKIADIVIHGKVIVEIS